MSGLIGVLSTGVLLVTSQAKALSSPATPRLTPSRSEVETLRPLPEDLPRARPPFGQVRPNAYVRSLPRPRSSSRRVELSILPTYSAVRLPYAGRPAGPLRGGGLALEVDVRLHPLLYVRAQVGHAVHPLREETTRIGDSVRPAARAGVLHATSGQLGLALLLDTGRILPMLEAGLGAVRLAGPESPLDAGQRGASCGPGGGCDPGLACQASTQTCQPTLLPMVHAGLGLSVPFATRWALGANLRYHALLSNPSVYPVWLTFGMRLSLRW